MQTILVADIFGRTEALEVLASELSEDAVIFDPYERQSMNFSDESDAYHYFTREVGVEAYTDALVEFIHRFQEPLRLIGFSVGASAIWRLSDDNDLPRMSHAICFYGSQIRHHINVLPRFPISLIFPNFEPYFSVTELMRKLSDVPNVSLQHSEYPHGFMNACSQHFDREGYQKWLRLAKE